MGKLQIMDHTGDRSVSWDKNDPESVKEASKVFNEHINNKHMAYKSNGDGTHEQIRDFNPDEENIVMHKALQGG